MFWSAPNVPHTIEEDAPEIIHKLLAYGTIEDIRWLKKTYGIHTLRRVLRDHPLALYTPSGFHFAAYIVLHLEGGSLDSNCFVKSVY